MSSGNWRGTHAAGFFNKRLFGIHVGTMYEVLETSWRTIAGGYSGAKFFVQNGAHMYTVLASKLNRVTITGNKARKEVFGCQPLGNPLTMVSAHGHLFCAVKGYWKVIDPASGYGETLGGKGNPTAAVDYHGWIYAINPAGNIDLVDPTNGNTFHTFNYNGLFKGSRGIVEYKNMLYAIGKGRFYEIDPITGKATAKGSRSNWQVDGVMAAASW